MPIVTSLVAALLASHPVASGAAAPVPPSAPAIVVNVTTANGVSPSLVTLVLEEADAVWRGSGIAFVWRRVAHDMTPYVRTADAVLDGQPLLHVIIGDEHGVTRGPGTPLGWIVFDAGRDPQPEIYLSHANARALMAASRSTVGLVDAMPIRQREIFLGRALGRALAHELGHYLLASKAHTKSGLLKAIRTPSDLFSIDRRGFQIVAAERRAIAARLGGDRLVVSR
jgi:hypothetical protein